MVIVFSLSGFIIPFSFAFVTSFLFKELFYLMWVRCLLFFSYYFLFLHFRIFPLMFSPRDLLVRVLKRLHAFEPLEDLISLLRSLPFCTLILISAYFLVCLTPLSTLPLSYV